MTHMPKAAAAMLSIGAMAFSAPAVAGDDVDTFRIDVVLEDLADAESMDEFEERLASAARDYCRDAAPTASRRSLRQCEARIIEAVEEAIAEDAADEGVAVAWQSSLR